MRSRRGCETGLRFNGLPYLFSEIGVFVEVAVTVQSVTLSQIHPVLDGRNRPILAPTAFDINSSIQPCLVKAITLYGLGLYIYAGGDLPQPVADGANDAAPTPVKPSQGPLPVPVGQTISSTQQATTQRLASAVGTDVTRVLDHFGINSLKEIRIADYLRVVRALEKRRAA